MERVIDIFNRLFVLWVILAGILAFFYPGLFIASRGYMELFFACTMFGIGIVFVFICIFTASILVPIWSKTRE